MLHEDTRPSIPVRPGQIARRDYEYKRCGTANVFCGIEPKAGVHFTKVTSTRSSPEFAEFILQIAEHYPTADTIHLVLDNLSTNTRKALVDHFGEAAGGWLWERFTVHYTPKHGSWLDQAEIEIGIFSRQCLGKRRIGNIATLRIQAKAWNQRIYREKITIEWKRIMSASKSSLHRVRPTGVSPQAAAIEGIALLRRARMYSACVSVAWSRCRAHQSGHPFALDGRELIARGL